MKTFRSFYEQLTPQELQIRYIERQQALKQKSLENERQQREQQEAKQRAREEEQAAREEKRKTQKISDLEQRIQQLSNQ
jgi:hypothetical protein